jgi:hypothetical protein
MSTQFFCFKREILLMRNDRQDLECPSLHPKTEMDSSTPVLAADLGQLEEVIHEKLGK